MKISWKSLATNQRYVNNVAFSTWICGFEIALSELELASQTWIWDEDILSEIAKRVLKCKTKNGKI
jgi:hypothetical protein